MTCLDSLQAVLDLPDCALQVVSLQLLIVLSNAIFDNHVQLDGLRFRDGQVAHEFAVCNPVSVRIVVVVILLVLGNLLIFLFF